MTEQDKALAQRLQGQSGMMTITGFKKELDTWRKQNITRIQNMIGGEKNAVRLFSGVGTAIERNPKLLAATRESLHNCILASAVTGLVPGLYQECAYLPFKDSKKNKLEAVFCPMYHGLVRLCYESGYVKRIDAKVVYENDTFVFSEGLKPELLYSPFRGAKSERGKPIGAYCLIINKYDEPIMRFVSADDILEIKNKAPGASSPDSPWNAKEAVKWESMWTKTALKQNLKFIPKTRELQEAIDADDRADGSMPQKPVVKFMTEEEPVGEDIPNFDEIDVEGSATE